MLKISSKFSTHSLLIKKKKFLNTKTNSFILIGIILSTFKLYLGNTFIFEDNQLTKKGKKKYTRPYCTMQAL